MQTGSSSARAPGERMGVSARALILVVLAFLLVAGIAGDLGWWRAPAGDRVEVGCEDGSLMGPAFRPELTVAGSATAGIAWPDEAGELIRRVLPPGTDLAGKWKYLVFHHSATTAGGAQAFDGYHRQRFKDKNGVEYQFVIGNGTHTPDGAIEATSRWGKQLRSGHVKNPRRVPDSIAVCVVGDFTRQELSPAQFQACVLLARALTAACGIPLTRVTAHRLVDGTRHTECPGGNFPLERLKAELAR